MKWKVVCTRRSWNYFSYWNYGMQRTIKLSRGLPQGLIIAGVFKTKKEATEFAERMKCVVAFMYGKLDKKHFALDIFVEKQGY
ncbi:MAG: hypothetical protein ACYDEI_00035 [Erysipelotrichaceae bacterium]